MVNRVVLFDFQSLSDQVYNNYYLDRLIKEGFKVDYADLTCIYHTDLYKDVNYKGVNILKFESLKSFERYVGSNDSDTTLYVSRLTFTDKTFSLFQLFKKYKCKISVFTRGSFPTMPSKKKIS